MPIEMSEKSYQEWYDILIEFFTSKGSNKEESISKTKEILKEVQDGWPHAPKDVETRIKMKSGYKWKSHNNLVSNPDYLPNVIRKEEKKNETVRDMYQWESNVSESELAWWKNREAEYEKEFEFNNSSDRPLLYQLLVEELTQKRLGAMMLKNPKSADNYSKLMTESLKRLQDTQTKLGITREQRADAIDNKTGDVSSLSVDLDEKIRRAKLKVDEWDKEAAKFKFKKSQTEPINPLPPISKIEALLGLDKEGNIGKKLYTADMADMAEEAATIHDETLETEEIEEPRPSIRAHENSRETDEDRTDETN